MDNYTFELTDVQLWADDDDFQATYISNVDTGSYGSRATTQNRARISRIPKISNHFLCHLMRSQILQHVIVISIACPSGYRAVGFQSVPQDLVQLTFGSSSWDILTFFKRPLKTHLFNAQTPSWSLGIDHALDLALCTYSTTIYVSIDWVLVWCHLWFSNTSTHKFAYYYYYYYYYNNTENKIKNVSIEFFSLQFSRSTD